MGRSHIGGGAGRPEAGRGQGGVPTPGAWPWQARGLYQFGAGETRPSLGAALLRAGRSASPSSPLLMGAAGRVTASLCPCGRRADASEQTRACERTAVF